MGIGPGAPIMTRMAGTSPNAAAPASASSQGRSGQDGAEAVGHLDLLVERAAGREDGRGESADGVRGNQGIERRGGVLVALLSAGLGTSGGSGRGTRDLPRPGTQRLADDRRRSCVAEDRAPGGLEEAVEPGEASEGGVHNAGGPRRQVAGCLEARDASGEVGGRPGEQRGPGGVLLAAGG